MKLNDYVEGAISTESRIDEVRLDPNLYAGVVQILIAAGEMLDQIKKNVFYGREYNQEKLVAEFTNIVGSLDQIKQSIASEVKPIGVLDVDPRVFHSIVGIATESTELLTALTNEELDRVNILEESFDVDWYQFILMDALDADIENVWNTGLDKLKKRYPDKFTKDAAINRNVDKEIEILNNGFKDR